MKSLFDPNLSNRCKAILQLFLYCYAYLQEYPDIDSVMPVIYKLSSMKESGISWKATSKGKSNPCVFSMSEQMAKDFVSEMAAVIKSLYDDGFVQLSEDAKSTTCNYCRFIDFCRRTPVKHNW